jgi:YD repeat-containing protein
MLHPNLRYRVRFETTANRLDYEHDWGLLYSYIFYQRVQLDSIVIQHDPDGNGDFSNAELVRSYDLVYASSGNIFPNYTWTEGGKTLTLVEIHEHGEGGAGPLPATTFTYGDGMHLTYAANGSGGWVEYSYTAWNDVDAADAATLKQTFGASGNPCDAGDNEGGWGAYDQYSDVYCEGVGGDLVVQGTAQRGIDPGMWHPGGMYQIYARLKAYNSAGDNLYLGVMDGAASYLEPDPPGAPISHWAYTPVTVQVQLPTTAYRLSKFLILVTRSYISDYKAQWLPTYYRVTEQTVGDLVTGAEYSTEYNYDEPATNDAQHSHAVAVTDPYWIYTDAYTEFRGHAMTRVRSQDDQVTTTFYAQDDAHSGRAQTVITGTEMYWDDFTDPFSFDENWQYDQASASLARLRGDEALKLTGGSSYAGLSRKYYTLTNDQSVLVQFQTSGELNDIILGVETGAWGSDYLRYGIRVRDDGLLWTHYCSVSGCADEIQMIGPGGMARDTWYVLLLIVDDDHNFQLRVWQRDDPSVVFRRTRSLGSGLCWRSMAQSMNGVLWLDAYSEGYLNTLSDSLYDADSNAPIGVDPTALPRDVKPPHPTNTELTITWARVIQSKQLIFGGDAQFVGARSMFEYDSYGNVTRVTESDWDPIGRFRDYRLTQTGYAINTSGVYLVGLPAYVSRYTCRYQDAYQANGACSTSYPGWLPTAWVVSSGWYLYDNHTTWNEPPVQGVLTGQLQLLRFASPATYTDPMYADTRYVYDQYGNQTDVYLYPQENSASQFAYGTPRHTTTCYETFDRSTGACTDDGYHTYPSGTTNALNHRVYVHYDPVLGLPDAIEDANGNTTTAAYDAYGRMIEIRRPGDSLPGQATVQIVYHLASAPYPTNPFYTEFLQKIDGVSTYRVNKYYTGLGQLLQSEVHGAMVGENARDLLVDIFYDLLGRAAQQSVPYDLDLSTAFQGRQGTYFSLTTYDHFGRADTVSAPDGSSVSYAYEDGFDGTNPYLETYTTDANGNITLTRSDLWGRTVLVDAPDGPSVSYTYRCNGKSSIIGELA